MCSVESDNARVLNFISNFLEYAQTMGRCFLDRRNDSPTSIRDISLLRPRRISSLSSIPVSGLITENRRSSVLFISLVSVLIILSINI